MIAIENDKPVFKQFWEAYQWIKDHTKENINLSKEDGVIAINLHRFCEIASRLHLDVPSYEYLKRYLVTSDKYLETKVIKIMDDTGCKSLNIRCWCFSA